MDLRLEAGNKTEFASMIDRTVCHDFERVATEVHCLAAHNLEPKWKRSDCDRDDVNEGRQRFPNLQRLMPCSTSCRQCASLLTANCSISYIKILAIVLSYWRTKAKHTHTHLRPVRSVQWRRPIRNPQKRMPCSTSCRPCVPLLATNSLHTMVEPKWHR